MDGNFSGHFFERFIRVLKAQRSKFLFTALCVASAALPLSVFAFIPLPIGTVLPILIINFSAWMIILVQISSEEELAKLVDRRMKDLGFTVEQGDFQQKFKAFLSESARFHKVTYGLRFDREEVREFNLGSNLQKIVSLGQDALPARSVELVLYDANTGRWVQSLIAGDALTTNFGSLIQEGEDQSQALPDHIHLEPLSFAGANFGALCIEFYQDYKPSKSDRQVVKLLASQASLMLIDARFNEEILRMRRLNEESVQAKTGFLANLSHELRGPLGIILNATELQLEGICGELSAAQKNTLRMIHENGEHLLDLVNDVLDYAKIQAGKIIPKTNELALRPLLEDLTKVVRSQAVAKQHRLVLKEVDDNIGILCDKRHFRQMLINFLTNAIKYTPPGGNIIVGVELKAPQRVRIYVRDNGIGIPESEKSKVFGAFERVNNSYAEAQVGTGLGMPLTKQLAEVNGGAVGFETEENNGSTFWINLPYCSMETLSESESEQDQSSNLEFLQGHGEKVLLVDKDVKTREMIGSFLNDKGYQIIHADNGADVLKRLNEKGVQLAIIENDLPDLKGKDVISAIRSVPAGVSVPIILLSADAFIFDIEQFLKLGVDRCLTKPIKLKELALSARRLIDETRVVE